MVRPLPIVPVVLCIAVLGAAAPAQAGLGQGMTAVSGSVASVQGAPIAGARITFVARGNPVFIAFSGPDGAFRLALPSGDYRLSVTALGFRPLANSKVGIGSAPVALKLVLTAVSESLVEIGRVGVNSGGLSTSSNVTVEINPQSYSQNGIERVSDILSQQIGLTAV